MSRSYTTLSEISLTHTYYTLGACNDFQVKPTAETARLLEKYRLLFGANSKTSDNAYSLLQLQVDGSTLIALPAAYQFRFTMRLKNSGFHTFTEIDRPASQEIFFFENQTAGASLMGASFRKMPLVGDAYHWIDITAGTVTVTARHVDTNEAFTAATYTEAGKLQARIEFAGAKPGVYRIFRDAAASHTTEVYVDPTLTGGGFFGIIHLTKSTTLNIAAAHSIAFTAAEARWKYFLVLKGNHGSFTYAIQDKSTVPSLTFGLQGSVAPPYALTSYDQNTVDVLESMDSSANVLVYVSSQSINYRESARSFISLGRTTTPEDPMTFDWFIANLPNPSAAAPNAAVIVSVDSPLPT